jgi:hypothetical protein
VFARRARIVAFVLALAIGLAACGHKQAHPTEADANNNGGYVDAGPVTYQLQVSRVLNPYQTEDANYIKGLPAGFAPPRASQQWYGVFLWAKNQTHKPQITTNKFVITDTQGNKYYPIALNATTNPFTWTSRTLQPLETEPGPDTAGSWGPTQGGLLLFKVNDSVFDNRPLTLYILGPQGQKKLAAISLDL